MTSYDLADFHNLHREILEEAIRVQAAMEKSSFHPGQLDYGAYLGIWKQDCFLLREILSVLPNMTSQVIKGRCFLNPIDLPSSPGQLAFRSGYCNKTLQHVVFTPPTTYLQISNHLRSSTFLYETAKKDGNFHFRNPPGGETRLKLKNIKSWVIFVPSGSFRHLHDAIKYPDSTLRDHLSYLSALGAPSSPPFSFHHGFVTSTDCRFKNSGLAALNAANTWVAERENFRTIAFGRVSRKIQTSYQGLEQGDLYEAFLKFEEDHHLEGYFHGFTFMVIHFFSVRIVQLQMKRDGISEVPEPLRGLLPLSSTYSLGKRWHFPKQPQDQKGIRQILLLKNFFSSTTKELCRIWGSDGCQPPEDSLPDSKLSEITETIDRMVGIFRISWNHKALLTDALMSREQLTLLLGQEPSITQSLLALSDTKLLFHQLDAFQDYIYLPQKSPVLENGLLANTQRFVPFSKQFLNKHALSRIRANGRFPREVFFTRNFPEAAEFEKDNFRRITFLRARAILENWASAFGKDNPLSMDFTEELTHLRATLDLNEEQLIFRTRNRNSTHIDQKIAGIALATRMWYFEEKGEGRFLQFRNLDDYPPRNTTTWLPHYYYGYQRATEDQRPYRVAPELMENCARTLFLASINRHLLERDVGLERLIHLESVKGKRKEKEGRICTTIWLDRLMKGTQTLEKRDVTTAECFHKQIIGLIKTRTFFTKLEIPSKRPLPIHAPFRQSARDVFGTIFETQYLDAVMQVWNYNNQRGQSSSDEIRNLLPFTRLFGSEPDLDGYHGYINRKNLEDPFQLLSGPGREKARLPSSYNAREF